MQGGLDRQYLIISGLALTLEFNLAFVTENIILLAIAFASGAMLLWPMIMKRTAGASLNTLGATRMINDTQAIVLDVRATGEFDAGHLPNARNIPLAELAQRVGELPAGRPVIVCCNTGMTSAKGAAALRKAGREEVFNLDGGLNAWRQAGLPVVKN
jgi:rhodanese-related sulfurtransferase